MTTDKHDKRAARELAAREGISYTAARRRLTAAKAAVGDHPDETSAPAATEAPRYRVKESTRLYAEELRSTPGTASADGHTGWECDEGASLIVEASTPGPGKLGTHHGVIYACAAHRDAAVERITGGGYDASSLEGKANIAEQPPRARGRRGSGSRGTRP